MSRRRCLGLLEGTHAIPIDFLLKTHLPRRLCHKIDRPAKGCFEALLKLLESSDVVKSPRGRRRIESDGHIDIGLFAVISPRCRPKKREAYNAKLPELPLPVLQLCNNRISVHANTIALQITRRNPAYPVGLAKLKFSLNLTNVHAGYINAKSLPKPSTNYPK